MKVELGSSIEDSQGDQSNKAMLYEPISKPSFVGHLSGDNVPKTTQYLHATVRDQIL